VEQDHDPDDAIEIAIRESSSDRADAGHIDTRAGKVDADVQKSSQQTPYP
jgi:hypothetical protein